MNLNTDTDIIKVEGSSQAEPEKASDISDFGEMLSSMGINFTQDYPYLRIGPLDQVQGWILHLSCIEVQVRSLIKKVVPFLQHRNVSYKIPKDLHIGNYLLGADFGYQELGKIVKIYPKTDSEADELARELIQLTIEFRGPAIATDVALGGILYTRYGGFFPILRPGPTGEVKGYIYDRQGKLVIDEKPIPFKSPKGVRWPFFDICKPVIYKTPKIFKNRFIPLYTIKADVKGRVMKGILVKKWELDWCIIKEGKAEMWADPFGRTIGDRIKWQYQVQKQLQHAVTVPKVVKLFTHNRDVYFVMDYIEGVKLSDAVFSLLDRKSWFSVSFDQKEQLLSYLQKIVCIVKAMHGLGIINRDLNSDNFIVQKDRTIYLIDLELSYSTKEKYPTPPFLLGTPGFMSLEQQRRLVPTVKEDVFGLGALCIVFLTGINPTKFSEIEESMIADHLNYFLRDRELAEFVAMCLKPIRKQRPEVEDIHIFIKRKAKMIHEGNDTGLIPEPISTGSYRHLIDQLLKSYTERPLIDENGLWLSKLKQGSSSVGNEVTEGKPYLDWGEGISGILFTLAKVKASGIDISMLEKSISVNAGFVMEETKKLLTHLEAGLFYHSSGIAFSVTHLLNEKLIQDSYKCREVIKNCLCIRPTALNLEIGLAGHGLSLLHCRPYLDNYALQNDLEHCIKRLLDTQRKEGYWIIKQPHDPKGTPFLGFTNGSAGILYFLIECNHLFHNGRVEQAIINGLDCMENSMVKENGVNFWPISYRSREAYPWLAFGFPGIVVTFIKAFERTGIEKYKEIAEKVLEGFPIYLVHNNLSFHFGLPGIGELYLEAKRVFQTDKYDQRINWIAGALLNTSLSQPSESVFWLTNETTIPFGDFLTGNAGVLHFFTRYVNPKIKFPFSL